MYFGWNEHPLACLVRSFSFKTKNGLMMESAPKFTKLAFHGHRHRAQGGGHFLGFTLRMFNSVGSKHVALLILKRKATGEIPTTGDGSSPFFGLIKVNVKPEKHPKPRKKHKKKQGGHCFLWTFFFLFRNAALAHTHRLRLDPEDANVGTDS